MSLVPPAVISGLEQKLAKSLADVRKEFDRSRNPVLLPAVLAQPSSSESPPPGLSFDDQFSVAEFLSASFFTAGARLLFSDLTSPSDLLELMALSATSAATLSLSATRSCSRLSSGLPSADSPRAHTWQLSFTFLFSVSC